LPAPIPTKTILELNAAAGKVRKYFYCVLGITISNFLIVQSRRREC
jgi:hypothetical protein